MKVLDLFSGIGGFSFGLEKAGMETVAFCEIDRWCQEVLKKNWPSVPIYDDVQKIKGDTFKDIDLICGGFPCQDISIAGQKKGFEHDGKRTRSGLWEEFKRVIKEIKPRYAIIENVAHLRNLGLNQIIKDLWSIGYACEWHIISARSVGAPHLRERIWVVAYPNGDRCKKRISLQAGNEGEGVFFGGSGETRDASNATSERLERASRSKQKHEKPSRSNGKRESLFYPANADVPRLWQPFASEKEKSEWWAKATASFRNRWQIESGICRMDDGISERLDRDSERKRKERVKQLGNSVVPQIPELIGREIMRFEND